MSAFIDYINENLERLRSEEALFMNSDRIDDANFVKIRINIFEVCKTIFETFSRIKPAETFCADYAAKLDDLRGKWEQSKALAEAHGKTELCSVETTKIETINEISNAFYDMKGR